MTIYREIEIPTDEIMREITDAELIDEVMKRGLGFVLEKPKRRRAILRYAAMICACNDMRSTSWALKKLAGD